MDLSKSDAITFHFDGNNNDPDDIAGLPIAAALAKSAGIEGKTTFFYGNNLSEPNNNYMVSAMRQSADFAKKLGIDAYSYQDGIQQTTDELVDILNSGKKVLAIEGGPMEAVYRALEQTSPDNRSNITLLSHSTWNEDRSVGSRPGGGKPRTWQDIRNDFPEVEQIEIDDQNQGEFNGKGFFSNKWNWLDNTDNPVLQEAREKMKNANKKFNDPSDAGMLFYAITGNESAGADDAKVFFDQYPPAFASLDNPNPTPQPPVPEPPASSDNDVFLGKNGQLIIEAESADPVGAWRQANIAGEQSVLWDPAQSSYNKVPIGQTLTYHFKTDEAGSYNIALRSGRAKSTMNNRDRYENGTGGKERTDTGNDAYVSIINDETGEVVQPPTKLFTSLGDSDRTLRWGTLFDTNHKKSSAQVDLEDDTQYRLEITGRSDGYVLDRITLSNDGILRNASIPQSPIQESSLPVEPTPPPVPEPTPQPTPEPVPPTEPLLTFALADAETDQIVTGFETITSQSILNLSELDLSQYTLIAQVNPDHPSANSIKSIQFESDFANITENVAPYALFGDVNGDLAGEMLAPGDYSIKATAYTQKYGQGNAIDSFNLDYSVVESIEDTDLLKLALVNAETNAVVAGFEDLAATPEVNLNDLELSQYNLVALVNPEHSDAGSVKSVRFETSSENSQGIAQQSQRTENVAPYAVFGDISGNFFEQPLIAGEIAVKAVAYTEKGGAGDVLDTLSVDYSVVDAPAAQAPVLSEIDALEIFSDRQSIALDYAASDVLESHLAGQSDSGSSGQDLLGNDGTPALGLDLVVDPSVA